MAGTWHVHIRIAKKKPRAEQQRQQQKAALLQAFKEGLHSTTPTFRPSETICRVCGAVFYCPVCFKEQEFPPAKNGHVRMCFAHREMEVQA